MRRHIITAIAMGFVLGGCGGSSSGQHPSSGDADLLNQRGQAFNTAGHNFEAKAKTCPAGASFGACLDSAIQDSNVEAATASLRGEVQQVAAGLDSGQCKSGLQTLEKKLDSVSASFARWRSDIAARAGFEAMNADAATNARAWNTVVGVANATEGACNK